MPLKKGRFDISKREVRISRLVKSSADVVERLYDADWFVFLREYISYKTSLILIACCRRLFF